MIDYFLPGFRGGGPIRTLDNMRKQLGGEVVLSVFTRDRDLGAHEAYKGIKVNQWNESPDGPIYYASPDKFGASGVFEALKANSFDIIYLNSFFSPDGSIFPLIAIRRLAKKPRVLLAPRGEFSKGALELKWLKKQLFLSIARLLNLHGDVFWHASTPLEAEDIRRIFPGADGRIFVAADPVLVEVPDSELPAFNKTEGQLRIAFISRISPMKNIDGLLRIIATVSLPVRLDIFGPVEDESYWAQCTKLITELPNNIVVTFNGSVKPDSVSGIFAEYDLFTFPTHGENFGHVIFESLRVGTPVLVSDQTPWQQDDKGGLTVIPLHDIKGWRNAIEVAAHRNNEAHQAARNAAQNYAVRYAKHANTQQENLNLFFNVLSY